MPDRQRPLQRLVQLTQRTLHDDRVAVGSKPVFEALLEPHERIVGVSSSGWIGGPSRKTEDHYAVVWIETDLGGPDDD